MVGYGIWNKVDMISWLLEGIVRNFDSSMTEVGVVFDSCYDGSIDAFNNMRQYWLDNRGYPVRSHSSSSELFESGIHSRLIDMFLDSSCDLLVVAQDDQRFLSSMSSMIDKIFDSHDRVGIIGGRDGFNVPYENMVAARHSQSMSVSRRLQPLEFHPCVFVNSGPIIYSRKVLAECGKPVSGMIFYVWEEYSLRANKRGFQNFVADMDIEHAKFGRVVASRVYQPDIAARDRLKFECARHG